MKTDIQTTSPAASDLGKGDVMHLEETNMTKIDAIAEDPSVTLETFAHLDINKILRKVVMRLVPMLTILVSLHQTRSLQRTIR
jgi:hypothetical protein